jgi:hypothetical protein
MPTRPTLDIKAEMSLNHTPERSAMPTSLNLDIRAEGSTNHTPEQSSIGARVERFALDFVRRVGNPPTRVPQSELDGLTNACCSRPITSKRLFC